MTCTYRFVVPLQNIIVVTPSLPAKSLKDYLAIGESQTRRDAVRELRYRQSRPSRSRASRTIAGVQ